MFSADQSTWSLELILKNQEEFCRQVNGLLTRQDTSAWREEIDRITDRLSELRLFVNRDLEDRRLLRPGFESLATLAKAIRQLGALIAEQTTEPNSMSSKKLPADVVADLFKHIVRMSDCLRSQLQLLDSTERYVVALADVISELVEDKEPKFSQFRNLTKSIQADDDVLKSHTQLLPVQGLELSQILSFDLSETIQSVCLFGVQSARLVNWFFGKMNSDDPAITLLVQAALLQNVGLVLLSSEGLKDKLRNSIQNHPDYERHPNLGSAIASNYVDAPCELSMLLAQHHERLDGTGYPGGFKARQLTYSCDFLITEIRFQELLQSFSQSTPFTIDAPWNHLSEAAVNLFVEAKRGELNYDVTVGFLKSINENWPQAIEQKLKSTRSFSEWLISDETHANESSEVRDSPNPSAMGHELVPKPHLIKSKQTKRNLQTRKSSFHSE